MAERAVERLERGEHHTALGRTVRVLEQKARHEASIPMGAPSDIRATPWPGNPRDRTARHRLGQGFEFAVTDLAQPLVGRDRELEVIGQLLREACAGSPRFVFITGEPGIGKTRLLLELLGEAESRGALALRGRASEFERSLPFGLLVDAFDEYLESLDPREFSRLATDDLRELAAVFPALRSCDPECEQPTTAGERFRAYRAVRELIERLAARHPVLLVLDDLHWADGASLELASYLLRHPPRAAVMVAATFRTGQADRQLAAAIDRATTEGRAVESLALGPLTPADAKSLIDAVGATDHERFYDASGGNPLYLIELARMTRGGPGVSVAAGPDDVPDAIAAAIVGELDALAPQPRRLAEAAAVAGDPFDLALALATAGMVASDDAVAALDDLVAHDLVRAEDVPRRFHFRHPLVRRAVYESCPPGARLVAHRRTAAALAARGEPPAAR